MGIDANNTWNIWNICVREQPQNHYANPPTQRIMDIKKLKKEKEDRILLQGVQFYLLQNYLF